MNVLLGVLDKHAFSRFERNELEGPMSRKELSDRTIYVSRPMPLTKGAPKLCDLSEARFGDAEISTAYCRMSIERLKFYSDDHGRIQSMCGDLP